MPRLKAFDETEVLHRAMLLFWKKGYYDTSVQDLVDFLGINRASLYSTFGGKKQLFDRAFAQYRAANFNGLRNFLATQNHVKAGLRQLFRKIVDDDCADPDCKGCFIVNTTTELLPVDPELQQAIEDHRARTEQVFQEFLLLGVERGQIPETTPIEVISRLLYTLMTGLRVVAKTRPAAAESLATVDAVLSLLD